MDLIDAPFLLSILLQKGILVDQRPNKTLSSSGSLYILIWKDSEDKKAPTFALPHLPHKSNLAPTTSVFQLHHLVFSSEHPFPLYSCS